MTAEKFMQELLATQDLSHDQENTLQAHKKEVTDFLRTEFGNAPQIKYAGSHEKGTMIAEQYDLDIVCYFPSTDNRSLKEIRGDVANHLRNKYLIDPKASAERIMNLKESTTPSSYHIDVVPGRFIEDTKDVFLHVAYGEKERMQTNLKLHIDHILDSGCGSIIRLTKLWACRNNVGIKTFVLELFVIRTLSGDQDKGNLQKSFIKVLEAFRDNFGTVQLVDPANSKNVVSQLVSSSEKAVVANAAKQALNKISESDDMANWEIVFRVGENKHNASSNISTTHANPARGFTPHGPWCSTI